MHRYIHVLIISFVIISCPFSKIVAQMSKSITYQGHLFNDKGEPVDGKMRMTFSLYDDPQSVQFIHQETQDIGIERGYYTVQLGLVKPFAINFERQYFLSVSIDGIESKRVSLTAVPYAIKALGVNDTSVYEDDIHPAGSNNGEALISTGTSVKWGPVISSIIGDGTIQSSTIGGVAYVSIAEGSITPSKIAPNSISPDRLLVPRAPKDKQYLSFDSVRKTLIWVDAPSLTLTLPYKQQAAFTDTLFSIRNTRNGPAGRFSIETNPGTHHALIAENNGVGSAIAGFAKGNGNAGYFSSTSPTGTASGIKVEYASRRHAMDVTNSNSSIVNTSAILSVHQSNADSSFGMTGMIMHANPGNNSAGLRGIVSSTGNKAIGVHGIHAGKGIAILGSTKSGVGVIGQSEDSIALVAKRTATTGIIPAVFIESNSGSDSASALTAIISNQQPGIGSTAILGEISVATQRGSGVIGKHAGSGIGVEGISKQGIGIRGASSQSYGVYGMHLAATGSHAGVYGTTASLDSNAIGTAGVIEANAPGIQSAGVRGINNGKNANGFGIYGSHAGLGIGIFGMSQSGTAMQAYTPVGSQQGIGVRSVVEGNNAIAFQARTNAQVGLQYGVDAIVSGDSAIAIRGKAPVNAKRTSYAGLFEGHLSVSGGDIMRVYQSGTASAEKRAMPIAYGSVGANGVSSSGTQNYACLWDINTKQYFITIHQEGYSSAGYITVANAVNTSEPIIINTTQVGADILAISCYTLQGQKVQTPFHFMVYKP